uniref:Uncharacterized protein n=1 Tax=Anopheles funestus TaxID=62324 RepID=A0A182S330_ANOFN
MCRLDWILELCRICRAIYPIQTTMNSGSVNSGHTKRTKRTIHTEPNHWTISRTFEYTHWMRCSFVAFFRPSPTHL